MKSSTAIIMLTLLLCSCGPGPVTESKSSDELLSEKILVAELLNQPGRVKAWLELTGQEVFDINKSQAEQVPLNNPEVKILQGWSDLLVNRLNDRLAGSGRAINVPAVHVMVEKSDHINMISLLGQLCSNVPVRIAGASTEPNADLGSDELELSFYDFRRKPSIYKHYEGGEYCPQRQPGVLGPIAAKILNRMTNCQSEYKNGTLVVGSSCVNEHKAGRISRLRISGGINGVMFSTSALQMLNPMEIIAFLAHEIGHVLMNHNSNLYPDYFYNWGQTSTELIPRLIADTEVIRRIKSNQTLIRSLEDKEPGITPAVLREHAAFYVEGRDVGLGWYTSEEEADNISLELFTGLLGIDPKFLMEAHLKIMEYAETQGYKEDFIRHFDDHISYSKCDALYQNRFLDENGKAVRIPQGDFIYPHHSDCFRVWNFWNRSTSFNMKGGDVSQFSDVLNLEEWQRIN